MCMYTNICCVSCLRLKQCIRNLSTALKKEIRIFENDSIKINKKINQMITRIFLTQVYEFI